MSILFIAVLLVFFLALVYALVLGAWHDRIDFAANDARPGPAAADDTLVTVVVPARNAADTVVPLLQDLHAQRFPKERMEVVLVNDHSSDDTAERVRAMQEYWPGLRLVELEEGRMGKKNTITRGLMEAAGKWVVLTDADARCGPDRVPGVVAHLQASGDDLVVLPVFTTEGEGLVGLVQHCEQLALQGATLGAALAGTPVLANGANLAFKREAFFAVGGYQGDRWASGDDLFLLQRMQRAGRQVACLARPECAVVVQPEQTWRGFLSQRLRWAGKMRAYRGGAGQLAALTGVLLPWTIMVLSVLAWQQVSVGEHLLVTWALLVMAGTLWLVSVIRLALATRAFFAAGAGMDAAPRPLLTAVRCLFALGLFMVYAPVIAILSIFVRPTWKGRRI